MNNFILQLIAGLSKTKSKQQIKSDAKSLGDMYVKLIGNLDMPKTRKAIKAQLKGLNNLTFNITPNVNTKGVQTATKQAINNAQRVANNNKVHLNFDTSKQQLVNQIKILGRNNNKLFNNREMTAKYEQLLSSANAAKSTGELKTLRGELSAFKTELVATNNAGMTWGSKFKESIKSYAKFFSGASFIYAVSNQIRNAATEAKTLDDSLVDLQKVTDEISDRDSLYKYFDKSLSKAQELNVKVGSLIDAVTEFKKLGWDLDDAELGAKWANILSNVGDVDIDTAIGSIKTSIASFDEIGGYGNDQMDKKLEAYTDLINNMSNKYSIDAEGLAESIRLSAGTLTEAHMSIEQAATMFATANKYYNDPSYLGNTAKIGSLRMRASSGDTDAIDELQEMGEEVDDLATATSNLREKLMALTGADIMEDEHTFKSYYDQLYEISQVMDKLDDTSRANVLETMFGKSRSAAGAAILSGMQESASAYEDAINSAGSATEEYQTWMTSADAACQRFSNTLTETYQSIINGNTVRDLANLGSAVLELANKWGIVEGTLKGVIALNLGKFIATGGMALITATKQVEQYGKALQMASNVPNGNLSARFQALKSIAQATSTLTTEQLRNVLATNTLTQADRVRILQMQGMTKEMALQKLAEMNLTQATNAQTAANTASTASTFSLKAAMTGLGRTIQSVFLSNPVGIVLMGVSLGVSALTSYISKQNQALEETRQKAKEAADNANTLGDEIAELANKYIQLSDAVKTDASAKEDLMTTQTELLKKLGLEGESIDDLIAKYGSLSNAIKQASIDSLKDQQIDLIAGVDAAREELIKAGKDAFGSDSWKKSIVAMGEEAGKAWQVLEDAGIISSGTHTDVGGEWFLSGDASEQGVLENYKTIEKALEALRDSNKFTQEELSQNDLFKELYDRYNTVKEAAESYDSEIDNLNENLAQQTMLTALQGNELPKTEEDFNKFKQELIDTAVASKQFIGNEKEITDAINNYLSTVPEFEGYYSIPLENELDKVDELLNQEDFSKTSLSEEQSKSIDTFQSDLSTLQKALESVKDGSYTASDFTDLFQSFPELEGKTENLEQALADLIYDKLQALYETLGESVPDDLKDSLQEIADVASGTTVPLSDAYSDMKAVYEAKKDFNEAMSTGMTEEVLNSVASLSTELESLVAGYHAGAVSADELYAALQEHYDNDLKNYGDALIKKNEVSEEFYKAVGMLSATVINQFKDDYGIDISNCKTYNEAKLKIEEQTVGAISKAWAKYYDAQAQATTAQYNSMKSQMQKMSRLGEGTEVGDAANKWLEGADDFEGEISNYKKAIEALNNIVYNGISSNFDGLSSSMSKNAETAKQVTTETIDFIEIALDRLSTKISELDKTASNAYISMSKRSKAYQSEIEAVTSQITLQNQAYSAYMAKANSIGLGESWASQIRNGSLNIADITDDTLKEQIKNYQTWYEKALDAKNAVSDLEEKVIQLKTAKIQLEIDVKADKLEQIEAKYDKLQSKLDLRDSFSQLGSEKDYKTLNKYVSQQIKNLNEQNELVKQQQSIVKKGSESWYEYQSTIDSNNSSIQSLTKSMVENAQAMAELANTKADNKVDTYDSADELLKARIENSSSYKKQNSYINKEIANIKNRQKAYDAAVSTNKSNLNSASKKITKTKQIKGSKSDKTYNSIVKEAQSCVKNKKEISGSLIQKAQSLYPDFARAMAEYNAQLASYNTSKATADLYKETSKQDKIDLAKQKSDNIETYYSNRQEQISQRVQEINDNISIIEAEGYAASKEYYKKLISLEKKNNKSLTEEKAKLVSQLQSALKDKSIDVNSNEYYELQAQIDDITNSINQSNLSLAQFEKELQQLKWDNFDSLENKISSLASEMDFLVNEFSNEDLTDSDTGKLTDAGNAVMGLRASKYTAFTQQINDYKKQIESIDKELAKDPYNETLIDRKQALYEAYQSVVSAAQDEKYAIIDLAKQGYDALLDKIKDLISKYEELLDSQKDAYEYQQKMDELVKERSAIQKQLAANAGDISEEGRANIQKLNVQLQEAEKSIQEAQYDKMISAQKDMLSDLQDDMTDAVQDIVDSLSENFETLIAQINANSTDIAQTISAKMDEIGYVSSSNFRDLLDGSSITTETRNVVNGIKAFQTSMEAYFKALVEDITSRDSSNEALKKLQSSSMKSIINNRDKAKSEADSHHEARDVAKSEFDAKQAEVNDLSHRKSEQEMNAANAREAYQSALAKYGAKSSKTRKAESNYNYQLSILNGLEDRINKSNSQLEELYQKYKTEKSAYNTANAKYKALDYLANHLNAGSKTADEYSDVNKALFTQYSGMVLSGDEMKELAELLGVKYNNAKSSGNLYKKLKSLSIPGFKVGSRYIPDDMLVTLGEDDMTELHFDADKGVLRQVGKGDKVFTNEMTNRLWELSQPNAFDFTSKFIPANFPTATRNTSENISVTFGDIQMYGVNDPDAFAKQLREEICKNGKTTKCIVEAISAKQLGKTGVGNARLYQR